MFLYGPFGLCYFSEGKMGYFKVNVTKDIPGDFAVSVPK